MGEDVQLARGTDSLMDCIFRDGQVGVRQSGPLQRVRVLLVHADFYLILADAAVEGIGLEGQRTGEVDGVGVRPQGIFVILQVSHIVAVVREAGGQLVHLGAYRQ